MDNDAQFQKSMRDTLNTFLSSYPLYKKLEIYIPYAELDEREIFYEAYCKVDNRTTHFKVENLGKPTLKQQLIESGRHIACNSSFELEFTVHCSAVCQICWIAKAQFLILGKSSRNKHNELEVHIQKVGQYPAPSIQPDKILRDFMTEEDIDFYKKGKSSLDFNYGIGAYAYFRRILENEILNIAHRIINTDESAKATVTSAVEQYFRNHQTNNLIRALTPYLPKQVLINSENPLFELYAKLSEGIHGLTEDECTDLAMEIEAVLRYVIIEMRHQETKDEATNAFKKLKDKSKNSNNS